VTQTPEVSAEFPGPRTRGSAVLLLVRVLVLVTILLLCLVGLASVALRLTPAWVPGGRMALRTGMPPLAELTFLFVVLLGAIATLVGLQRWETQIGRARAQRYRAWARERDDAREQARIRVETERADSPEAVLVVDLVQSTELIREQGDEFFRDLLRRIETTFIPVARSYGTRAVDGHGDGFLFCFERADQALDALRGMYARLPGMNRQMPAGVEIAFRASLHVGPTFTDTRGNRTGLAVLKAIRLGGVMEVLHGRGAGRNSLVLSEEALVALGPATTMAKLLGRVTLRGFPGRHPVYQLEV
jgi:class 3 adenylate cyclase